MNDGPLRASVPRLTGHEVGWRGCTKWAGDCPRRWSGLLGVVVLGARARGGDGEVVLLAEVELEGVALVVEDLQAGEDLGAGLRIREEPGGACPC